jgi:hypothetical protein
VVPDMDLAQGYGGISALWGPWWAHHNVSQLIDDLTKEAGSHSLKLGVTTMFSITPVQSQTSPSLQGAYSFDGSFTGNAIADALLGLPVSYSELNTYREPYYNFHQTVAYVQDDWKVTRRLTLNLGLRWFFIPHVYGKNLSTFAPSQYDPSQAPTVTPQGLIVANSGNLLNGIIIAGKNGVPLGLVQNHYNTPAPRFGFAYDPTGSGKWAIRGGYGIGYHRIEGNDAYGLVGNPPFSSIPTFFDPPFNNPASGVAAPLTPASLGYLDPVYDLPTVQSWSLNVQREHSPPTRCSPPLMWGATAPISSTATTSTSLCLRWDMTSIRVSLATLPLPTRVRRESPRITCAPIKDGHRYPAPFPLAIQITTPCR